MNPLKYMFRLSLIGIAIGSISCALAQTSGESPASPENTSSMHSAAPTEGTKDTKLSNADREFVKEAASGGMAEVELGRLAEKKAGSEDVKQFGERMVRDHSKANDQLKQIASSKGIALPQHISAKYKTTEERLSQLSGSEFDRAYMADMVKDHKADIAAFRHESSSGSDAEVKGFASETLPTLKDHLKAAESTAPERASSN
ncbi:MAG: DUF4142 domain-containing protein [Terriglobales bacterium]